MTKSISGSDSPLAGSDDDDLAGDESVTVVMGMRNLRRAPAASSEPEVTPCAWRLREDEVGRRYLVCLLASKNTARITSPIVEINFAGRYLTTSSTRRYQLVCAPTEDPVELGVLFVHATINGVDGADVSDAVWREMLSAVQ